MLKSEWFLLELAGMMGIEEVSMGKNPHKRKNTNYHPQVITGIQKQSRQRQANRQLEEQARARRHTQQGLDLSKPDWSVRN